MRSVPLGCLLVGPSLRCVSQLHGPGAAGSLLCGMFVLYTYKFCVYAQPCLVQPLTQRCLGSRMDASQEPRPHLPRHMDANQEPRQVTRWGGVHKKNQVI